MTQPRLSRNATPEALRLAEPAQIVAPSPSEVSDPRILRPGATCWRLERASRVAPLIDAASYFEALEASLRAARRSVLILGWDIHSRARLGPRTEDAPGVELRDLLREITERRPELRVHVLSWDFAPLFMAERELLPRVQLGWRAGPRVILRLDSAHPVGGSQHQKVVVVDDRVAFSGGIDLTIHRWDTPEHAPLDGRRRLPGGDRYPPFHDAMMMVDGDAAAALAEMARDRWRVATGEPLAVPEATDDDRWPPSVEPVLRDVEVGIARTLPAYEERAEAREVERLYLEAIAAARRWIYVENQYFTSAVIGEALERRLAEEGGPEIVVVTTREESGPLEKATMGALRADLVRRLREADPGGRFRILTPVVETDVDVYVHAKVLVVDDRLALIGSANLCNRSMGLDSECDLAIEGTGDDTRRAVASLRCRLLAEHLGVRPEDVRVALSERGSLLETIDALASDERRLVRLEVDPDAWVPLDPELLDPAEPVPESFVRRGLPEEELDDARRSLPSRATALALLLFVLGCLGAWLHLDTPDAAALVSLLEPIRSEPSGPPLVLAGFVVASLVMVPVNVLIVASVALLGPWLGGLVCVVGIELSAALGWLAGRAAWGSAVRRLAGERLGELRRRLAEHGVKATTVVRLIPIAPFSVVSLVAGSARVSLRDFLLGTLAGSMPGVLLLSFASDRVIAAVLHPDAGTIALAALAIGLLLSGIAVLRRVLRGS